EDERVAARHDADRVELQGAEVARHLEQAVAPGGGARPGEALAGDGEAAGGGGRDLEGGGRGGGRGALRHGASWGDSGRTFVRCIVVQTVPRRKPARGR